MEDSDFNLINDPPTKRKKTLTRSKPLDISSMKKEKIAAFVDNSYVVLFMTMITIYALFFDDIRIIAFTKHADNIFFSLTTLSLVCFTVEISLASYAKYDEYYLSFFFWLDVISTLSLIADIGWIMDNITG